MHSDGEASHRVRWCQFLWGERGGRGAGELHGQGQMQHTVQSTILGDPQEGGHKSLLHCTPSSSQ